MFKALTLTLILALAAPLTAHAKDKTSKRPAAEIVAQADVSVGLSGLVCDFCSIALNKTFKKKAEVAATHVDLDTKKLSVMFKAGANLDDAAIEKLVKKAGYNVTGITRKQATQKQAKQNETAKDE
jgi:cation transport ATPase